MRMEKFVRGEERRISGNCLRSINHGAERASVLPASCTPTPVQNMGLIISIALIAAVLIAFSLQIKIGAKGFLLLFGERMF